MKETLSFELNTQNSSWQMKTDPYGMLQHVWYGAKTGMLMDYLERWHDTGFSGQIAEAGNERSYSLDTRFREYPSEGNGDYRLQALKVRNPDGTICADLRFIEARWTEKKPLFGLPASFGADRCLQITLQDETNGLAAVLEYGVYEKCDVITRSVKLTNTGSDTLVLEGADSGSLDLDEQELELVHFYGRHNMEREMEILPIGHTIVEVSSRRGASSHQHNPAVILKTPQTTETHGEAWGIMLLYSGSFSIRAEKDQLGQTRICAGINPETFSWTLKPGESFQTPEVAFSWSPDGLGRLSRNFHAFIRHHVMRSPLAREPKPVLINNWEATYFNFTRQKLLKIAAEAAELGVDLFVLDDGWFGKRNSDLEGLGDWTVNEEKVGDMKTLIEEIQQKGLKFGLWIEPEMVSEDSDLYRAHPEWVIQMPQRKPGRSRFQLVLDYSSPEVVDAIYTRISALLRTYPVSYIKWDMNRSLSDWYTPTLEAGRQKEMAHRYTLGVYDLLNRLTSEFPEVLFEGCAGGGGRFDAGMLYYVPQIWTSDDTDARERTRIQYGTSFFYPLSAMGSHVSAIPNHQTGRTISLEGRGMVAMAGTFGYELDPSALSAEEKDIIRQQIRHFHDLQSTMHNGSYARLSNPYRDSFAAWQTADADRLIVQGLRYEKRPNSLPLRVFLQNLDPAAVYEDIKSGRCYTAQALMNGGLPLPDGMEDNLPFEWIFQIHPFRQPGSGPAR